MDNRVNALIPLFLAQMFKFFSHYGVRAIFVLYLVQELGFTDANAFALNAVFIGLVELGGIFGGVLADRYLGLRQATFLGAVLLGAGYFALIFEGALFIAMGFVIAGGSLFSSNITALVGQIYAGGDPGRERGFTIFYMVQNLGALVSIFLCSVVAQTFGFQAGFACAATGMAPALFVLLLYRTSMPSFESEALKKNGAAASIFGVAGLIGIGTLCLYGYSMVFQILPLLTGALFALFAVLLLRDSRIGSRRVFALFVYLGALVVFFAIQDQICSSLVLFSERATMRVFLGWEIPSALISCVNPVVIILVGTSLVGSKENLWAPFLISAAMFCLLAFSCLLRIDVTIFGVMAVVAAVSVAELMLGPMVMSFASEVAALGRPGMVMGIVPIAYSLAFQMSAAVGLIVAMDDQSSALDIYGTGFLIIAGLLCGGGLLFQLLGKRTQIKLIPNLKTSPNQEVFK